MAKHKASTIIFEGQDKPLASKERHYVPNKELYAALVERKAAVDKAIKNNEEVPKVSEYIGECFFKIADNLSRKYNFANIPYREDMVLDATLQCIEKVDKFDPEKSNNPFSYFTQTCYYEFLGTIAAEKDETYVKFKSIIESSSLNELASLSDQNQSPDAINALQNMDMSEEYMEDFIRQYEEKKPAAKGRKKRAKRKRSDGPLVAYFGDDDNG